MLITVRGRLVRSHGVNDLALPGSGVIQYQPAAHGTHEGALRGVDPVPARITDGEAEPVELTPGPWRVSVFPEYGDAWEPYLVELTEDMDEPVDLADLAPVLVIDGERWATGPRGVSVIGVRDNGDQTVTWLYSDGTESDPVRIAVGPEGEQGDRGDQGASVTGAVDHGDGTVSFTLSDGGVTEPVVMPPGPAGRGVESISDPDEDSLVTITYTDGSTSTVQAVRGRPGDPGSPGDPGEPGEDGRTPVIEWDGTALVIDGETGPDLQGPQGEGADVDWDTLDGKPDTFTPATHTHVVMDVDGLQDALDKKQPAGDYATSADLGTKADASHTHEVDDVTGLREALDERTAEPLSRAALGAALAQQHSTGAALVFTGSSTMMGGRPTDDDHRIVNRIANYLGAELTDSTSSPSVPSSGVAVFQYSKGNTRSDTYLTAAKVTAVGQIKPVVMVHAVGSNDYYDQQDPSTYRTNLEGWLDQLRDVSPDTVHLYVVQHGRNDMSDTTHAWEDYTEALQELQDGHPDHVDVVDLSGDFAAMGIPGSDPWGLLYTDNVHLNDAGNRALAHLLCAHLGIPIPDGRSELYSDDDTQGGDPAATKEPILQVAVPAAPYPRVGTASATVYARNDGSGDSNLYLGTYEGEVGEFLSKGRVTEDGQPHSIPLVAALRIPPNTPITYAIWVNNGTSYVSSGAGWGVLAVQLAAD